MARPAHTVTMAQLLLHLPDSRPPRAIGWLSQFGDNLRVSFASDYVNDVARPTLSQLYRGTTEADTRTILQAVNDERLVRLGKLPAFFSNLLPEGHNKTRLAQQRGVDESDELELLAAAGHDLTGALEVTPATDVPADVLELHVTKRLEPVEPATVAAPIEDGFSVPGFQTKFSAIHNGRRYTIRRGTEAGAFIAKLPSSTYPDIVLNEGTCFRLASAVGINTAGAEVRPIAELDVPEGVREEFSEFLLVPRFDRMKRADGSTGRVHFEELTQALGIDPNKKYHRLQDAMRALLVILKVSEAPIEDFDEVFRRWTAYALMGNTDAHAKNWGLVYPDGRSARLAPAYDMVCVASYAAGADGGGLAINKKMDESLRAWDEDAAEALAKSAGLLNFNRARRVVRDTQLQAVHTWPAILADHAPASVRKTIKQRMDDMAPARMPTSMGRIRKPAR